MPAFVCATCGTQYPPSDAPPQGCAICQEERQYVNPLGQSWTTLESMRRTYRNAWGEVAPGLYGIGTAPNFAIGQRALLLCHPEGNVLWDCISLIDAATVALVRALGGLKAIAISHPHYYASMVEWAQAFGAVIYLHEADKRWVVRPDPAIRFWDGETQVLASDVTLIRCGGHFAGATVLHWAAGANGAGALLSGDVVQVGPDKNVSFMRSYPDLIPLDASSVQHIADTLDRWPFEPIYGAWWERVIKQGGKAAMDRSVRRYIDAVNRPPVELD